jgi:hypothetical protein
MGAKPIAQGLELRPQFQVVIDFSIEYDHRVPVARGDRLIARSQIEDLQPGCAEGAQAGGENSLLVWSAMSEGRSGCANPIRIATPAFLGKANNATQSANTSGKAKEFTNL